jgi:IS5 family transposase
MEAVIPWSWHALEAQIAPFNPRCGKGRHPYPLGAMLRVHCAQLFYNLSDPSTEEMLYEIESVRGFTGFRLEKVPDEPTILNFRRRLERNALGRRFFEGSRSIWLSTASSSRKARSSTPASSRLPYRPRMRRSSAPPRCTRRRGATIGPSA